MGKTTSNYGAEGIELRPTEALITKDGGTALSLQRLTSDGTILSFAQGGSSVGSIASVATGKIGFYGSGGTGAVIDSSGNVGIGTTSPSSKLHVEGASAGAGLVLRVKNTGANGAAQLDLSLIHISEPTRPY